MQLLLIVQLAVVVAAPLSHCLGGSAATFVTVGLGPCPLLIEVGRRDAHLSRFPQVRTLNARRGQLTAQPGQPALVMTSLVRSSTAGEGDALLRALQGEWNRDWIEVVFCPANQPLAEYYARHGAVPDGQSWRRMKLVADCSLLR